ncbi:MAG: hypothetical protein JW891_08200 [Candidatus Lokiarchaeota archaeon]|nr:hypothetical protein [Candidatus Lokiarchaeota archaeon]
MNLQVAYDKLYKHWLKEYKSNELTPLSQDSYEQYQDDFQRVKEVKIEKEEGINATLTKTYQKNFEYLLSDLLKIREIKLINAALALQAIDIDLLIEAEKLLYQNLVASLKGYDKTLKLSIVDKSFESINQAPIDAFNVDLKKDAKEIVVKGTKLESKEHTEHDDIKPNLQYTSSQTFQDPKEEDYNYVLIRFLKKTPPIVGIDLLNYGPYEKEDVASLPYKNAKIFVDEKYAMLITL